MSDEKILIVEDEIIVAMALEQKLLDLDYIIVDSVSTGEDAVKCANQLKPDLILMDITLKGKMNGIEAAKQIKYKLDIPIIYLTAYSYSEVAKYAPLIEPHEYLVKPFKKSELNNYIKMSLSNHRAKKAENTNKALTKFQGFVRATRN
ncbi:MAG: response regulator [Methanobacterium sp.]